MNMRYGRREALPTMLAALAMLSASCQLFARQVSRVTPTLELRPTPSPGLAATDTSLIPTAPTLVPVPMDTATPGSPPATAATSGPFRLDIPVDDAVSGTVEALSSTADGTLWLITNQGIAKLEDTTWTPYLTSSTVGIAGIDAVERVWVVNEDATQISAWNGEAWTTYGIDAGWTPLTDDYYQYVRGGQSDLLGRIWFATSQDVRVFDGNQWAVYTPQEMGMGPSAYDDVETRFGVAISRSGMVWVSECDWGGPGPMGGQGIRWLDQGTWRGASSPVASGCAMAIADDSLGRVWAGVGRRLWRYDPASGDWTTFASPEPPIVDMRFGFIDSLAVDPHDTVWTVFVLCGGASCYGTNVLYHFHDNLWTQVGEVAQSGYGYWGPIFDAVGMPWLSWDGGIYRIEGDSPELASPLVGRFGAMDNTGRVWFVAQYEGRDALWVLDEETRE